MTSAASTPCGQLTPVVTHAPRRKVLRCSCGALHIVWENLNLSLMGEEFRDLTALAFLPDGGTLGNWSVHHGEEAVGLSCGPLGATFPPPDWDAFVRLLRATRSHDSRPQYALN